MNNYDDIKRAGKRLLRVGIAGALSAVGLEFVGMNLWFVIPVTAVVEATWKFLRTKYPDYWLWKLL